MTEISIKKQFEPPQQKVNWRNISFFALTTVLGLVAAPIYVYHFGVSISEFLLFAFFMTVTPLSITLGYHRMLAHLTFKGSSLVQFLVLFFGAGAFEQSALKWASQHRDHHRFVDSELDPYNIKKGFFYAHIGWLIFWKHTVNYENVKDLAKSRMIMHQHEHYKLWAITSGVLLPLAIGLLTGHVLGALLISIAFRITLIYHATFCINSVCHTFGKATYDIYSTAKDHWLAAIITYGEGYHNYHHHFPSDYRNGVRWYQFDPTKWAIAILAKLGLAWELKKISKFRILHAKLTAENQRAQDWLKQVNANSKWEILQRDLKLRYAQLNQSLLIWERAVNEYQNIVKHLSEQSELLKKTTFKKMMNAKIQFDETLSNWKSLQIELFALA